MSPIPKSILLLHGLFGHSRNLRTFSSILTDKTKLPVNCFDLRNHYGSHFQGPMTLNNLKSDLNTVLNRPLIACGHSLGGKIILHNLNNQNIKMAIILDIGPKRTNLSAMKDYIYFMKENDNKFTDRAVIKRNLMSKIMNEEIVQFLMTNLKKENQMWNFKLNLNYLLEGLTEMSNPVLQGSEKPILFIKGSESNYIREEEEAQIFEMYPNSTIKTVKGSHWIHFISPVEIAVLVREFIDKNLG
eukprot:NODE_193_length_13314_cov_0.305638.p8 type:complete len:244 gc:universal NODE_193_length_13314_cov_0.305638:9337-10068(+)